MSDISEGIKDLLVAAGVGTFAATTGWGIFISKMPDEPDSIVSIMETGGFPANPRWLIDYPSVQVMIRGDKGGYQAAKAKALAVRDALLGLPSQVINGDGWDSITDIGGLIELGYDDSNRPKFSTNFSLIIEPATGTNRLAL